MEEIFYGGDSLEVIFIEEIFYGGDFLWRRFFMEAIFYGGDFMEMILWR